jgi:hypothetical protein
VSKPLVEVATKYPHPVLALESLDEIRDWACDSERFNFLCQLAEDGCG